MPPHGVRCINNRLWTWICVLPLVKALYCSCMSSHERTGVQGPTNWAINKRKRDEGPTGLWDLCEIPQWPQARNNALSSLSNYTGFFSAILSFSTRSRGPVSSIADLYRVLISSDLPLLIRRTPPPAGHSRSFSDFSRQSLRLYAPFG